MDAARFSVLKYSFWDKHWEICNQQNLTLNFKFISFCISFRYGSRIAVQSKSQWKSSIFQVLHFIIIFFSLSWKSKILRWRKRERNQMNALATAADFKNGFGTQFVQPFPDTDALYSSYSHYNNWAAKVPSPLGAHAIRKILFWWHFNDEKIDIFLVQVQRHFHGRWIHWAR